MATLTIRALDDDLKARLRTRAAEHGQSMEEEVRQILRDALSVAPPGRLGTRIHERFARLGGVELELPARADLTRSADLDG